MSGALAGLLLLGPVPTLQAQQEQEGEAPPMPPAQTQPELPDSIQELVDEFQETRQELGQIQDQAVQENPGLQTEQEALRQTIRTTMRRMHPELEEQVTRMETLQGEIEAAQQAQDQQQMMSLVMEAQQIQQALRSAQTEAMETDSVARAIERYEENLMDAMLEIDPQADEKMDRLQELADRLQAYQESQGGTPSGPGGA